MSDILEKEFFLQPAERVALGLLESDIVRKVDGKEIRLPVNEVEVYEGFEDKASHASRGKTERNKVMFEEGGIFYVYLVYGMHFMLNVVTGEKDYPAAILIRGAGEFDGPGKLTKALQIDMSLNGCSVDKKSGLWFEKRDVDKSAVVERLPRIGVDYAGEWAEKPYRFVLVY